MENQTLAAAAEYLLLGKACRQETERELRACLSKMSETISTQGFSVGQLSRIHLGRHNVAYRRPIFLATLILRSMAFRNESGKSRHASFLINVSSLFERYVAVCFTRFIYDSKVKVMQNEETHLDIEGLVPIKPDFVIKSKETEDVVLIADTKYKKIGTGNAVTGDVHQMLAYMLGRNCPVSVLIYPEPQLRNDVEERPIHIRSGSLDYFVHHLVVPLNDPRETAETLLEFINRWGLNISQRLAVG